MTSYDYLTVKTAEKLLLSDDERIHHIKKPRWIGYSRAKELLNKLEDLYNYPTQTRMPNMLIIGETNNGKTVLVNKFRDMHPPQENLGGENLVVPVLYIQAPPSPDERGLYNAILTKLFEPYSRSESTDTRRDRVISVLSRIDLGMLIIDEIQHLLAGSYTKQRNYLNSLKYLGNELCVPIVGIGTAEAIRALQADPQLSNRFMPEVLPKWDMSEDYLRLLSTFESVLPLKKPSNLHEEDIATHILAKTGGTIGEISTLLNKAAINAIKLGQECISVEILNDCDYIAPALRKRAASSIDL